MKRIAVIGCSHSDADYHDRITWSEVLAKQFPNLQFDNYAQGGHGHLHMNMVLNYCLYVADPYDLIIVGCSGISRWEVGVEGSFSGDMNTSYNTKPFIQAKQIIKQNLFMDKQMKTSNLCKKLPNWPRLQQWYPFTEDQIDNINEFNLVDQNGDLLVAYTDNIREIQGENNPKVKNFRKRITKGLTHEYINHTAKVFSWLFRCQLDTLSHQYPIYWFSTFQKMGNNIGYPQHTTAFGHMGEILGADVLFDQYMDDTRHLNEEGHKYFVDNYIMPSELGKKIVDLSNS